MTNTLFKFKGICIIPIVQKYRTIGIFIFKSSNFLKVYPNYILKNNYILFITCLY